jgi:sec-independent protein translocase protein TatA
MFDGAFANPIHWIFAIIVLVLVFGPSKLGDIGGALGKSVKEFKQSAREEDEPALAVSAPADAPALAATAPTALPVPEYRPGVPEYRPDIMADGTRS